MSERARPAGRRTDAAVARPLAEALFTPLAADYERWATVLSLGQDPRWRRTLAEGLDLPPGSRVLDAAAGTGSITGALARAAWEPVAVDLTRSMLRRAARRGFPAVEASAEELPFVDASFDGATFGYLLRYVASPLDTLREIHRVLRPGGQVGMLDFGRPVGPWGPPWWLYTRVGLPLAGAVVDRFSSGGWFHVGRFLGPSIDGYYRRHPLKSTPVLWEEAGFTDVRVRSMSLGGGLIVWARRP